MHTKLIFGIEEYIRIKGFCASRSAIKLCCFGAAAMCSALCLEINFAVILYNFHFFLIVVLKARGFFFYLWEPLAPTSVNYC